MKVGTSTTMRVQQVEPAPSARSAAVAYGRPDAEPTGRLVNNNIKVIQEIWRMKIPLKIKIFIWYVKKGVILTKDNLVRRNWKGSKTCCFYSKPGTIQHFFLECH
jgi:hypothetical protein